MIKPLGCVCSQREEKEILPVVCPADGCQVALHQGTKTDVAGLWISSDLSSLVTFQALLQVDFLVDPLSKPRLGC